MYYYQVSDKVVMLAETTKTRGSLTAIYLRLLEKTNFTGTNYQKVAGEKIIYELRPNESRYTTSDLMEYIDTKNNRKVLKCIKILEDNQIIKTVKKGVKGVPTVCVMLDVKSKITEQASMPEKQKEAKKPKVDYTEEIKEIRSGYPTKNGSATAKAKLPKLIKEYGKEQLIRAVKRYIDYVEEKRAGGFKTLQYKNESTFWNSGYVDYLDCNYTDTKSQNPNTAAAQTQKSKLNYF